MKIFTKISNLFFYSYIFIILVSSRVSIMRKFTQISTKPGFLKNNGGLLFRKINNYKFDFKDKNKKNSFK